MKFPDTISVHLSAGLAMALALLAQAAVAEHVVPMFPAAADPIRQGFVRILNPSNREGEVSIRAYADSGTLHGMSSLNIGANAAVHFNSNDLENDNAVKGLVVIDSGSGDWHLDISSDLNIAVLAYMRTEDGFVTSLQDLVGKPDDRYEVPIFNPGSNNKQRSLLRIVNPSATITNVTVTGVDDRGKPSAGSVSFSVGPKAAVTRSAQSLEEDGLGDGEGKWRLHVVSSKPVMVMSLLSTPTGHVTNLSSAPGVETRTVPLFASASNPNRQGFVRIINRSNQDGSVTVHAIDDSGAERDAISFPIRANEAKHFNSDDLENGNSIKGIRGVGPGNGDWRLEVSSALEVEVLAYMRTEDGFLTSLHDLVQVKDYRQQVPIFNPGGNRNQVSQLRVVNPSRHATTVAVLGIDDLGELGGAPAIFTLQPRSARTLTSPWLEENGLGDGKGKWRLEVFSTDPILAMSLLSAPTGHLTNLSTFSTGQAAHRLRPGGVAGMRATHGGTVALQSSAVRAACGAPFSPHCEWTQIGGPAANLNVADPTWPRFEVPAASRAGANLLFSANCDCGGGPASDIVSIEIVEKSNERTLSALVDFTDVDASDRPLTRQDLADLLTDNADSLDKFMAESSRGLLGVQYDVLDWVTVRKARSSYPLGGGSVVEDAVARLSQAADLSEYDKVLPAIYPLDQGYPGCIAYLNPQVWQTPNGSFELGAAVLSGYEMGCVNKGRMAHEYGHTFGFRHSYAIDCHTMHGVPGSTIDPLDENDSCFISNACANEECTEVENGPSDVVANQDPDMLGGDQQFYEPFYPMHFQSVWQARAGWLADAQIAVAATSDGFWLTPLETFTPTRKAIKVPLGLDHRGEPQSYWLEMRQRYPLLGSYESRDDDPCSVHVRLEANHLYGREDEQGGRHTYRFYTYDEARVVFAASAARLGQPFWDPHRGVRVEILNCIVEGEERLSAVEPFGLGPRPRDMVAHVQVARTRLAIDPPVVAVLANGEASVSLRNGGPESVAIGSVSIGGRHPSSFSVASDSCSGVSLEYGETCSIAVRGETGGDTALLRIPSDDELAPEATVSLMATRIEGD